MTARAVTKAAFALAALLLSGCAETRLGLLADAAPTSAVGAPADDQGEAAVQALVADDARVARVAYRLSVANAELCQDKGPQYGLTLHSASQYGPRLRAAFQRLYAAGDLVAVSSVTPDGPAEAAGLRPGDVISRIGELWLGSPPSTRPINPQAPANYTQIAAAQAALSRGGATGVDIEGRRDGRDFRLHVTPRAGCAYDTQVMPSQDVNASADGRHVFITSAFVAFAADDDDLALILGHELAHDVLQHRAELDRTGFARRWLGNLGSTPASLVRVEREADYVGLYLSARAGYSIEGAEPFWLRVIAQLGDPWWRHWSHPGARERAASARATVDEIQALIRDGQPLTPDLVRLRARATAPRQTHPGPAARTPAAARSRD